MYTYIYIHMYTYIHKYIHTYAYNRYMVAIQSGKVKWERGRRWWDREQMLFYIGQSEKSFLTDDTWAEIWKSEGDSHANIEGKAQPWESILSAKALRQGCTWHFQETADRVAEAE